ncbi:DUF1311 domain-containing protein [Labrys sp. LIt4]|uniref:Lysozyme inhibitor LprI-like N-terminal domain-containing protein n=1 Tax=Labrys okinawensis TaxID=346911 RepID=A0A2S9QGS2_9HYPH|nr:MULTISPECIES: lysozyme inhibitor LprI family protein [Labrys]MBP0579427.1 DUF1311 domain-containing protein [Labrys sp. LIt4]PRH88549.1 hypothetical protein C5L14_04735 [Labrys okinawensis]
MKGRFLIIATVALLFPCVAQAGDYAPLDCAKAASPAEKAVCGNYALGQAEARMATLYGISMSLVAMGQRGNIGEAQQAWIKTREACGADTACLDKVYGERIGALDEVIRNIASHGPF